MSKKTLLNEASVRRFMKLADMQGLSNNFLNEMYGAAHQEDEPDEDAMMDDEMPEMADDMGPEEDAPEMDDEMPEMPEMPEADEEADEVEITEDDRAALAAAIPVLEKIAGGGGADMDMDDMGDMDMGDEAGMRDYMEEGEKADMEEEVMEEAENLDEVEIVDENKLVQEVTRRVAERLRKAIKSRK